MNYITYYQPSLHSHAPSKNGGWYKSLEVAIGALLLISPMFWLFIAELVK